MSLVPWSVLQPDTIKAVIHDLGLAQYTSRTARKNELVKLLQSIELEGLSRVLHRLQDKPVPTYREREESPELEYVGPPPPSISSVSISPSAALSPTLRPVVEIPVLVRSPSSPHSNKQPRAGQSRTRAQTRAGARPSNSFETPFLDFSDIGSPKSHSKPSTTRVGPPTSKPKPPTTRVGPPSRKRARTVAGAGAAGGGRRGSGGRIDWSKIPPPSYAILYQQQQNISLPRKEPWPLLNPHETFAGVVLAQRTKKRSRAETEVDEVAVEETGQRERERESGRGGGVRRPIVVEDVYSADESEGGAVGDGDCASSGTGTRASTTASMTRRMEAVVVTTTRTTTRRRSRNASARREAALSDDEMDVEV